LTNIILPNHSNITSLNCSSNKLTSLDFLECLSSDKLKYLDISSNKFSGNLTLFSRFVNLKELQLHNNLFFGSLKPLRDLKKIRCLNIGSTDISHGLEYLSDSIEKFDCSFNARIDARVSDIWEELEPFEGEVKK
jgi:hypothetical protein